MYPNECRRQKEKKKKTKEQCHCFEMALNTWPTWVNFHAGRSTAVARSSGKVVLLPAPSKNQRTKERCCTTTTSVVALATLPVLCVARLGCWDLTVEGRFVCYLYTTWSRSLPTGKLGSVTLTIAIYYNLQLCLQNWWCSICNRLGTRVPHTNTNTTWYLRGESNFLIVGTGTCTCTVLVLTC